MEEIKQDLRDIRLSTIGKISRLRSEGKTSEEIAVELNMTTEQVNSMLDLRKQMLKKLL